MKTLYPTKTLALCALLWTQSTLATLITFDENPLAVGDVFHPLVTSTFTSGGVEFEYQFTDFGGGCCWGNITYSNAADTSTPGFTNQFAAITGDGAGAGQDNYAVSYADGAFIDFGTEVILNSAEFVTTSYTYLAVTQADDGFPGFGVEPGDEFQDSNDFLTLNIRGLDNLGGTISTVSIDLARGLSILDTWTLFSLSSLGSVHGLSFDYSGSDMTGGCIDTPTYFAIDNINYQAVPLPASLWLFVASLSGLMTRKSYGAR